MTLEIRRLRERVEALEREVYGYPCPGCGERFETEAAAKSHNTQVHLPDDEEEEDEE